MLKQGESLLFLLLSSCDALAGAKSMCKWRVCGCVMSTRHVALLWQSCSKFRISGAAVPISLRHLYIYGRQVAQSSYFDPRVGRHVVPSQS